MRAITFVKGALVGATAMWLLDPDQGSRRRARLRQQAERGVRSAQHSVDVSIRDLGRRAQGLAAEARALMSTEAVGPETLAARVRARIGHVVGNPRAVQVRAADGMITLTGSVAAHEIDALFRTVAATPGVLGVENDLQVLPSAELDGRFRIRGGQPVGLPSTPAAHLALAIGGAVLALYGRWRGGVTGSAVKMAGVGLFSRGVTAMRQHGSLGSITAAATRGADHSLANREHLPREVGAASH